MRKTALLLFLFAAGCVVSTPEMHVKYLASPELEGRETGTDGESKAARYIVAELRRAGLQPVLQSFSGHGTTGRNVIAMVPGTLDEAVVIGAHYDHLGKDGQKIYHGADDNASGTAVVIEMGRRFARRPAARTIVLIAFSGEEMGLHGSRHYVNDLPLFEPAVAMINLDMVGRLREQLIVFGADTGDQFRKFLADSPIKLAFNKDAVGPSDHTSFVLKGVPSVHLFTGAHVDYHKPTDTADKINYEGLGKVADLVETLARRIADAPERMKFVKPPDQPVTARPRPGATPYFGVMPDYGYEGKGVRLQGVAPGSPAEKAGLLEGDVIVSIDGKEVDDVKAYSAIFFARKPGDEMLLSVDRAGKKQSVKATIQSKNRSDE